MWLARRGTGKKFLLFRRNHFLCIWCGLSGVVPATVDLASAAAHTPSLPLPPFPLQTILFPCILHGLSLSRKILTFVKEACHGLLEGDLTQGISCNLSCLLSTVIVLVTASVWVSHHVTSAATAQTMRFQA